MNKNVKYAYKVDKFTDYTGLEREFIIAAVSVPGYSEQLLPIDDWNCSQIDCEKVLYLGVSVRHPSDKYDQEIGKKIAVGKALKLKGKQLFVSHAGLINTKMVEALLEQEAEYFKRDPSSYIAGYRQQERKWKEKLDL